MNLIEKKRKMAERRDTPCMGVTVGFAAWGRGGQDTVPYFKVGKSDIPE